MRTYEETHPWISFNLDLGRATYKTWLLLGQALAHCNHVAGMPIKPQLAEVLMDTFLIKGALATTAIEGNTLTEEEAQKVVRGELKLPPSKGYLGQEIDNILNAYNQTAESTLQTEDTTICVDELKQYNCLILDELPLASEEIVPGEIRGYSVEVGRYRAAPPEDLEWLLESLCNWLNTGFDPHEAPIDRTALQILKAIIAHVYIAWIHPFGDGNGRVARLVELQILLSAGIPMTSAHLLSNHYNQTRSEYYRIIDESHRHENGIFSFIEYALQGFVDGLQEQIALVEGQQLSITWRDFIYDQFKSRDSATNTRQRRLVLDLADNLETVPLDKLRHITPRIAEAYADKTDKTVQRDVNRLIEMGLVEKEKAGYRAKIEIMRAFLPVKRAE